MKMNTLALQVKRSIVMAFYRKCVYYISLCYQFNLVGSSKLAQYTVSRLDWSCVLTWHAFISPPEGALCLQSR